MRRHAVGNLEAVPHEVAGGIDEHELLKVGRGELDLALRNLRPAEPAQREGIFGPLVVLVAIPLTASGRLVGSMIVIGITM